MIIVGGASQMRQLRRYLQKYLQRPVRVGLPTGIGHLLDEYRTPAFASTLGLLLYGAKHEQTIQNGDDSFVGEVITALQEMWGKLFPTREK